MNYTNELPFFKKKNPLIQKIVEYQIKKKI
jgi:hypothetical protein